MTDNIQISAAEKLDAILSIFPIPEANPNIMHNEVLGQLLKDKGIDIEERIVDEIIGKLIRDGNIVKLELGTTKHLSGYKFYITFEGELLRETGGYRQKYINELAQIEYNIKAAETLVKLQEASVLNSEKLNDLTLKIVNLTRWIAAATLIAGLYYLLEILRIQYHLGLPNHLFFQ